MYEENTNERRKAMPILASKVVNVSDTVTEIHYESSSGATTVRKVPKAAVEVINIDSSRKLCIVSEFQTTGGVFRPEFVFQGHRLPAQPSDSIGIDLVDMVEQGSATKNIREYLKSLGSEKDVVFVTPDMQPIEIDDDESAWGGSLLAGGRASKTAPWDFIPEFVPNHIVVDGEALRLNKADGSAGSWSILNPLLKSEKRPAGALLGSVSDRYYSLGHPTWVKPLLKYAEMSNIKANVASWGEGAKCRVDIDVTQASQIRSGAANRMKAKGQGQYLNTDSLLKATEGLDGLYKFGFTINNSLDGRGSFNTNGAALRVYCQNLAVSGGIKTALNLRHTKGVMSDIDWDQFGLDLVNATAELNEWLVNTELLSWVPMDLQLMDRLMSSMHRNNLFTAPRIIKEKDTDKIKQVNRGHLDLAVSQGWKNPTLDYVRVESEKRNTAYHALQCFTGALTHKPIVTDDKRQLKGSVLGFDSFDNRLKKVNGAFMGILGHSLNEARSHAGVGRLSLEDKGWVMDYIKDNPHVLPFSNEELYTEVNGISSL